MKTNTLKTVGIAIALIVGLGTATTTQARFLSGQLGQQGNALVSWTVICSGANTYPSFRIIDLPEPGSPTIGRVYAYMSKQGSTTIKTNYDIDGGSWSPWLFVNQGPGHYTLMVSKDHPGSENFRVEVLCNPNPPSANTSFEPITALDIIFLTVVS